MVRPNFHKTPESWQVAVYAAAADRILNSIHDTAVILKDAGAKKIDMQLILEMVQELAAIKYGKRYPLN